MNRWGTALLGVAACMLLWWTACTARAPDGVFVCTTAADCPAELQCFSQRCSRQDPAKSKGESAVSERAGAAAQAGAGAPISCRDALENGSETDVDCGGEVCPACKAGASCADDHDCETAHCVSDRCELGTAAGSCSDSAQNGNETDVDCGGACGKCAVGERCVAASDCETLLCDAGVCAALQ